MTSSGILGVLYLHDPCQGIGCPGCVWTGEVEPPAGERPARNEPCHCGSGRKYKSCCMDTWRTTEAR